MCKMNYKRDLEKFSFRGNKEIYGYNTIITYTK